jgi:hypothetical protein
MAKAEVDKRKPYSKPTLTIYGKIHELAKTVGAHGTVDGGGAGNPRTKV